MRAAEKSRGVVCSVPTESEVEVEEADDDFDFDFDEDIDDAIDGIDDVA